MGTLNISKTTPKPDRGELHRASIDALLTVSRDRLDRIIDLENDTKTYRMLAASALYTVAELTKRNKTLAQRNDHLQAQIRALMEAPCLVCRRRVPHQADSPEQLTV